MLPLTSRSRRFRNVSDEFCMEVGLLGLPIFSLSTRGLATRESIGCEGSLRVNGGVRNVLCAHTDSQHFYPGRLSRTVHYTLLGWCFGSEDCRYENPIEWTWSGLCLALGQSRSGQSILHYKQCIASAQSLRIDLLGGQELSLYDHVEFAGEGSLNRIWLSDWYLENLNEGLSVPIKWDLWKRLNEKSSIASRLYELLLLNDLEGKSGFVMSYCSLAELLPVRTELYVSEIRKQLDPAIAILRNLGLVDNWEVQERENRKHVVVISRGPSLRRKRRKIGDTLADFIRQSKIFSIDET